MKKRLEKKLEKRRAAYYMASVIQSVAFGWSGFDVDRDDSDDFVKAVVDKEYDAALRIINYYARSFTTDQVIKENVIPKEDMAIPPKKLVERLQKYVVKEGAAKYTIYAYSKVLDSWEKWYHNRFIDMLEHVEYDDEDE